MTSRRNSSSLLNQKARSLVNGAIELMGEHPQFDVASATDAARLTLLSTEDRSKFYKLETLRRFQKRTRLVTVTAMAALPFFWMLYSTLATSARWHIALLHSGMFIACLIVFLIMPRVERLETARMLTILAYICFAVTAAGVMAVTDEPRIVAFSGHSQIIMSLLFMPFRWREAALCAAAIVISFAIGLHFAIGGYTDGWYLLQVASVAFTGVLMTAISFMQNRARQHSFNAAFDMALTAAEQAELSTHDHVTGGFNRRHIERVLEMELARAQRFNHELSLLMFDLDHFKPVNDTLGHQAGDDILREVWHAASHALRSLDTVARYGGDEFVAILPEAAKDDAISTAARMREAIARRLAERYGIHSLQARVTLSMGIATFAAHELPPSVEIAVKTVDGCMLQAKRGGRNRVCAL